MNHSARFSRCVGRVAREDRHGCARRLGINYNSSCTRRAQLAGQPRSLSATRTTSSAASPLLLQSALQNATPGVYATSPSIQLPAAFVQIYNLDLQRDLSRTVQFGIGYTGTKGTDLDLLRAPNRTPTGLAISGVQPFIWESSQAYSFMNSLTLRLRKRLSDGLAVGGTYTLSKSIDDASSIAATGSVAQNDQDPARTWALSISISGTASRWTSRTSCRWRRQRWLTDGASGPFGNWSFNGTWLASVRCPPLVEPQHQRRRPRRQRHAARQLQRQPIALSDPTVALFQHCRVLASRTGDVRQRRPELIIIGPGNQLDLGDTQPPSARSSPGSRFRSGKQRKRRCPVRVGRHQLQLADLGYVTGVRAMRRLQILRGSG